MGSKEVSAAWLVAAAMFGLFGWLQLAGVSSGRVPLAADVSLRAPVAGTVAGGIAGPDIAEEANLASNGDARAAGGREELICNLEQRSMSC